MGDGGVACVAYMERFSAGSEWKKSLNSAPQLPDSSGGFGSRRREEGNSRYNDDADRPKRISRWDVGDRKSKENGVVARSDNCHAGMPTSGHFVVSSELGSVSKSSRYLVEGGRYKGGRGFDPRSKYPPEQHSGFGNDRSFRRGSKYVYDNSNSKNSHDEYYENHKGGYENAKGGAHGYENAKGGSHGYENLKGGAHGYENSKGGHDHQYRSYMYTDKRDRERERDRERSSRSVDKDRRYYGNGGIEDERHYHNRRDFYVEDDREEYRDFARRERRNSISGHRQSLNGNWNGRNSSGGNSSSYPLPRSKSREREGSVEPHDRYKAESHGSHEKYRVDSHSSHDKYRNEVSGSNDKYRSASHCNDPDKLTNELRSNVQDKHLSRSSSHDRYKNESVPSSSEKLSNESLSNSRGSQEKSRNESGSRVNSSHDKHSNENVPSLHDKCTNENVRNSRSKFANEYKSKAASTQSSPGTSSAQETGWIYFDSDGTEQGPIKLAELKKLVEEGKLLGQHLIKLEGSDEWVSVEKARSPSDSCPSKSPMKEKAPDSRTEEPTQQSPVVMNAQSSQDQTDLSGQAAQDYHIDERVEKLLHIIDVNAVGKSHSKGSKIVSGLRRALHHQPEFLGSPRSGDGYAEYYKPWRDGELVKDAANDSEKLSNRSTVPTESLDCVRNTSAAIEVTLGHDDSTYFQGQWPSKGGDWKRAGDLEFQRQFKKRDVLNEGSVLCNILKTGELDPRLAHKDTISCDSMQVDRLELPHWAYNCDSTKPAGGIKTHCTSSASKITNANKGVFPTPLETRNVVQINSAIFRERGPLCWEPLTSAQHSEKIVTTVDQTEELQQDTKDKGVLEEEANVTCHNVTTDHVTEEHKSPSAEATMETETAQGVEEEGCQQPDQFSIGNITTIRQLKPSCEEWYYRDGAGREHGPYAFPSLQKLAAEGSLLKDSSVYRKTDDTWLPVSEGLFNSINASTSCQEEPLKLDSSYHLNESFPNYAAYARGKLHEHVMRCLKTRDFAAAVNVGLSAWMTNKNSKSPTDMRIKGFMSSHMDVLSDISIPEVAKREDTSTNSLPVSDSEKMISNRQTEIAQPNAMISMREKHLIKRQRSQIGKNGYKGLNISTELHGDVETDRLNIELDPEASPLLLENNSIVSNSVQKWATVNRSILRKIFRFIGTDLNSLVSCASTCKHWRDTISSLRLRSTRLDFSLIASECTDNIFQQVLGFYEKAKLKVLVLKGCTNVSADTLVQFLHSHSSVVTVDITGCNQFKEVPKEFSDIRWFKSPTLMISADGNEEPICKVKSLKQINEKICGMHKTSANLDPHPYSLIAQTALDHGEAMDVDDYGNKDNLSPNHQRTSTKRFKLSNCGKFTKPHIDDISLKGDKLSAHRATGVIATLLTFLKDIMSSHARSFFMKDVTTLEEKLSGGIYQGNAEGIKCFEDDYMQMCRKAFRSKDEKKHAAFIAAQEMFKTGHRFFSDLRKKLEKVNVGDSHQTSVPQQGDSFGRPEKDRAQHSFTVLNAKKRHIRGTTPALKLKRRKGMSNSDYSAFFDDGVYDHETRKFSRQRKRCRSYSDSETSESSGYLDEEFQEENDEVMDDSDSDMEACFEDDNVFQNEIDHSSSIIDGEHFYSGTREWGAKMTEANLVPPLSRKYETIDEYTVVDCEEDIRKRMKVVLPKDYEEKLSKAKGEYSHLDIPEIKDFKPRKILGDEVMEQEVYGIDPYTYNLLLDTMPQGYNFSIEEQHALIEEVFLRALNEEVRHFTGTGSAPTRYPLQEVVKKVEKMYNKENDKRMASFCQELFDLMEERQPEDQYFAYRKGLGVVCNKEGGFGQGDFVVEFLGEVYTLWRWYEKEDAIRYFQKKCKVPVPEIHGSSTDRRKKKDKGTAPEFYNIMLERPKGDGAGYDAVVIDAMHKANYASRICHSCCPNCEAKVTAVNGYYQIGLYTVRPIQYGEEITFDYNCVTESQEEFEACVCLCGNHFCRGSYFSFAGALGLRKVLKNDHNILHRHCLLLEACTRNKVSERDFSDLLKANVGSIMLSGLPDWAIAYAAEVVRFIDCEKKKLPKQILNYSIREKEKAEMNYDLEAELIEARNQAEGVSNQRLLNLAITLDKVRYILRKSCLDPTKAPPPLRKIEPAELVPLLWKGEKSLVGELIQSMSPYVEAQLLKELKQKINAHDPSSCRNVEKSLRESLLWLRDEVRRMPSTHRSRHDAAADLVHLYAHTRTFFTTNGYGPVTSDPLYITPLDLGPKEAHNLQSGFEEWQKTYNENYVLGQLIYWYKQTYPDPGYNLSVASRGCLALPDVSSCYAKNTKQDSIRRYGFRERNEMIRRMEKQPYKQWPNGELWDFSNNQRILGTPMFDAVLNRTSDLDKEMIHWLKSHSVVVDGP